MKKRDPLSRIREAKVLFGARLLANPDVHGIGIGHKRKGGRKLDTLALVTHVYKKLPIAEIEEDRRIPPKLTFFSRQENAEVSIPTDVREVRVPEPEVECGQCDADFQSRVRPAPGGYSIGLDDVAGGTLGGWVWDRVTESITLLSNEHILGSTSGDAVIQPSATDSGVFPADDLADVVRAGTLDAAIASPNRADDVELEIGCSGPAVFEIADATIGLQVEKVGQTTGLTCGLVELIDYDSGHYGSHADLWIDGDGNDFSRGGDSGSLYVEMNHPEGFDWKRIVGLHWGGSGNDGVGHPIRAVFHDLNLTTVCTGIIEALIEAIFSSEAPQGSQELESETFSPRHYPPPFYRRSANARFHAGIARDFENRIQGTRVGAKVSGTLRKCRVDVARILLNGDGWRVTVAALAPILAGKVTTDAVLQHRMTGADVKNFRNALQVARRLAPSREELWELGEKLLAKAEGQTLEQIITGPADAGRRHTQERGGRRKV